jgi:hypothetical protein
MSDERLLNTEYCKNICPYKGTPYCVEGGTCIDKSIGSDETAKHFKEVAIPDAVKEAKEESVNAMCALMAGLDARVNRAVKAAREELIAEIEKGRDNCIGKCRYSTDVPNKVKHCVCFTSETCNWWQQLKQKEG